MLSIFLIENYNRLPSIQHRLVRPPDGFGRPPGLKDDSYRRMSATSHHMNSFVYYTVNFRTSAGGSFALWLIRFRQIGPN